MRIFGGNRFLKPAMAALIAILLPAGACKKDEPVPPTPPTVPETAPGVIAADKTPGDMESGRPRAGLEAPPTKATAPTGLFASETLALVPANPLAAFVFRVESISNALGLGELLATSEDREMAEIRRSLMEALASESLSREAFAKAGIKPDSDLGLAVLDVDADAFVISVAISDRAAFMNTFEAFAARGGMVPASEKLGDYTLVTMKDNKMGALLINATHATFFGCNYRADAVALARAAVDAPAATRLAGSKAFAEATSAAKGSALGLYLSPGYLALVTDRRDGEAPLLGLMSGIALGVSLEPGEVSVVGSFPVDAESPLARAFRPTKSFAAQKLVGPNTLVGFGASFHPEALLGFILALTGAEVELAGELKAGAREFLNIDLDRDIIAKLTGEFGLTIDGPAPGDEPAAIRVGELKGAALIGVKDDAQMGAMLATLPSARGFKGADATWDEASARMTMPTNIGHVIAAAAAGAVIITNDADYLKANQREPHALAGGESVKAAIESGRVAAFVVANSMILQPFTGDLFTQRDMGLWAPPPEDDEADEATKKRMAELNEAYEAALTELRGSVEANQAEQMGLIRDAGRATILLESGTDGVTLRWQQTLRQGVSVGDVIKRDLTFVGRSAATAADSAVVKYNALRAAFQASQDDGEE